jgi:hypothetical protein
MGWSADPLPIGQSGGQIISYITTFQRGCKVALIVSAAVKICRLFSLLDANADDDDDGFKVPHRLRDRDSDLLRVGEHLGTARQVASRLRS